MYRHSWRHCHCCTCLPPDCGTACNVPMGHKLVKSEQLHTHTVIEDWNRCRWRVRVAQTTLPFCFRVSSRPHAQQRLSDLPRRSHLAPARLRGDNRPGEDVPPVYSPCGRIMHIRGAPSLQVRHTVCVQSSILWRPRRRIFRRGVDASCEPPRECGDRHKTCSWARGLLARASVGDS